MKRTRTAPRSKHRGPVSAILVSDIHLTDVTPVSRTDDYIKAQERKLKFLQDLSKKHQALILHGGDLFHSWKASPWLLAWAYLNLPTPMVTIAGNHDLPQHSIDQYHRSALHALETVMEGRLTVLMDNPSEYRIGERKILILHQLIWPESQRSLRNMVGGLTARDVLEKYPGYDLILTGDNHTPFIEEKDGCILVNPGSTMRSTADQEDHRPRCYLYYAESNTVEPVYLPIEDGVLDRSHRDKVQERNERLSAYIERIGMNWEVGLSFRQNLEAFFQKNNTPKKVVELIWSHMEG